MLESLMQTDVDLFLGIHYVRNEFFDFIAPWLSNRWIWIPLYIYLLNVLSKLYRPQLVAIIVSVALLVLASDQGANLFKNNVKRPRPCHNTELLAQHEIYSPEGCGGPYGFFSGHASNSFAVALFMLLLVRRKNQDAWRPWLWLFVWAFVVSWSRIYLGVHYPGDVFCGAVFGMIIAFSVYMLLTKVYLEKRNA